VVFVIDEYLPRSTAKILRVNGFGNQLRYPVGSHEGIVIAHFPNELSTSELNAQILGGLSVLSEDDLKMSLTILEPGKIRSRKN